MVKLSQGNAFVMLLFTGIVALILGMGMPTTGVYIICVAIMALALVMIGMPVFPVHLLILYYAVINCITPPVALAAYAAASLARASPMQTAVTATRLGIVAYFVPILFVYNQELLLIGKSFDILGSIFFVAIGVALLSMSLNGRFYAFGITWYIWQRIVLLAAAIGLFMPATNYRLMGLGLLVIPIVSNRDLLKWAVSSLKEGRSVVPE